MVQLENPADTLKLLYAVRKAALVALANPQAEIVKYALDGRTVEIRSFEDLDRLNKTIQSYESIVVATVPVFAELR